MPVAVSVVLRTRNPEQAPLTVTGTTPDSDCPLAVTPAHIWDHGRQAWELSHLGGFYVTHRPTGYNLGSVRFARVEDALAAIERADWRFPAWAVATGDAGDPAMLACRAKWKFALTILGLRV